jgi:O-antigen ligase/tetratricopeptide (TPR) repeat protein
MTAVVAATQSTSQPRPIEAGPRWVAPLRIVMEVVVLLLVIVSPWAFGAVHPLSEFVLLAGLSLLLGLWAVRMIVEGRLSWRPCPVALCLAGLVFLALWQMTSLPPTLLARLSPRTLELETLLRPTEPELVAEDGGEGASAAPLTLSLSPAATRPVLLRLLAVFALFAVVRNNLASASALRRLSVVALVNGTLLSLFALVQFFTSPRDMVYWSLPTEGRVFGPFICRNHFSFYVNLCVGLGVGLLLSTPAFLARRRSGGWVRDLLNQPQTLWIGACLVLMLAAVACSLSRGGVLAVAGGAVVCLVLGLGRSRRWAGAGAMLLVPVAAVALVAWLGAGAIEARLATLWQGDPLEEGRLPVWSRTLPLVKEFPVWGTGFGTFEHVEPMMRGPGDNPAISHDHAHNEYLETLIEGGAAGAALVLLAVAFVYWRGWQPIRRCPPDTAALALGCLFAFTTLIVHSAGDFGLRLPAIVVLATVLCAHLAGLADTPPTESGQSPSRSAPGLLQRVGALAGAAAVLLAAFVLFQNGWRTEEAERYRLAAVRCRPEVGLENRDRQLRYLEAAVTLAPDDLALHLATARAYHDAFQQTSTERQGSDRDAPGRRYQTLALRHYLRARDLCPLLYEPNLHLAGAGRALRRADPPENYLDRALLLLPCDARIWYIAGVHDLEKGRTERAWERWRRSLECSDQHLPEILSRAAQVLPADQIAGTVLPERPELLYAAGLRLEAEGPVAGARACFARALTLLNCAEHPTAEEWRLKARLLVALGQPTEAVTAYETALNARPSEAEWHYELAALLYRQGRLTEASREVHTTLSLRPGHAAAEQLRQEILNRNAEAD